MSVYNLYVYNRNGTCIYYQEWHRTKTTGLKLEEEFLQMFGLIVGMKSFLSRITPIEQTKDGHFTIKTNKYKLHYFETLSGIKIVLNTSLTVSGNVRDFQQQIYELILNYVVRDPLKSLANQIESELFKEKLNELIRNSVLFSI